MQVSPLDYPVLEALVFLLDWHVGKQLSRPSLCCELFCEDFMSLVSLSVPGARPSECGSFKSSSISQHRMEVLLPLFSPEP